MKILHTSDWHLGKRLFDKPRLNEQAAVLDELAGIADAEQVAAVVVAGDVYDTYNPSAEAERLFYRAAVRLAKDRILVAIAGNHDDADRLSAPHPLAEINNVYLGDDFSAVSAPGLSGGKGYLRYEKDGERLELALMSYPSETRCGERFDSYTQMVRAQFARAAKAAFTPGAFHMAAAHLFMTGTEGETTDERTLGAAVLVPPDAVPDCDYCALGHVHKPMTVSSARRIVYSGSLLNYRFGETGSKSAVVVDTADKSFKRIPLTSGKPLVRVEASTPETAMQAVADAGDAYVQLLYDGPPMTGAQSSALRGLPNFCGIEVLRKTERAEVTGRVHLQPAELFRQFYKEKKNGDPPKALTELFLSFLEEQA